MLSKSRLIVKVLSFQIPPKILIWGFLNTLNRSFTTGNRRFEFERLYLENPDPWNYRSSTYELKKYKRTLDCALALRVGCGSALEVGCSVGVFSRMISEHFDKVTAVDISKEALHWAADYNSAQTNIRFVHGYFESLNIEGQYDVIFCAEILYYIAEKHINEICWQLNTYLASQGIILLVTGKSDGKASQFYFDGWENVLANRFQKVLARDFDDAARPYRIVVFTHRLS